MNKHFKMGEIAISEKVCELIWSISVSRALRKYIRCDWGLMPNICKQKNDCAVRIGAGRISACYRTFIARKLWITTDNKVTTISLPEEVAFRKQKHKSETKEMQY